MAYLLCIETATPVCSIALFENDRLLGLKESNERNSHAELVTVFIGELLLENNLHPEDLSVVAVSQGPGSYTGLRIGVSVAKGLCYAKDIPLISVPTLQSLAWGAKQRCKEQNLDQYLFVPMIDARRMEVYTAIYNKGVEQVEEVQARIIDADAFSDLLLTNKLVFVGDGAPKCKPVITNKNAVFIDDFLSSAKNMGALAFEKFQNKQFEDVAYFEPFYLKEFVAGIPKVKGLR